MIIGNIKTMEICDVIQGCKENNPKAQTILHKLYYVKMLGVASKYSNGSSDVEDLVQEAFITIYANMHKFNSDNNGSLEGWLRTIVKNKTIDLYRKNKKINNVELSDNLFSDIDEESIYDLFLEDVPNIINSLSPQYKKVVTMYYLEGKKHNEISDILGISLSSSKSNLLRSKVKMKKTLLKLHTNL